MSDELFQPQSLDTRVSVDGSLVQLSFARQDGQQRNIVLARSWLPSFVRELHRLIDPADAIPINPAALRPGRSMNLRAIDYHAEADGGVLTLHMELPDEGRAVAIPVRLSRGDIADLASRLGEPSAPSDRAEAGPRSR